MVFLQQKSELSDVRLDLRTSKRELKSNQDTIQYLRESAREHRESLRKKDVSISFHF